MLNSWHSLRVVKCQGGRVGGGNLVLWRFLKWWLSEPEPGSVPRDRSPGLESSPTDDARALHDFMLRSFYIQHICRRGTQEYIVPNPLYWYPGEEERGSPAADARTHDKPPTQRHTTLWSTTSTPRTISSNITISQRIIYVTISPSHRAIFVNTLPSKYHCYVISKLQYILFIVRISLLIKTYRGALYVVRPAHIVEYTGNPSNIHNVFNRAYSMHLIITDRYEHMCAVFDSCSAQFGFCQIAESTILNMVCFVQKCATLTSANSGENQFWRDSKIEVPLCCTCHRTPGHILQN